MIMKLRTVLGLQGSTNQSRVSPRLKVYQPEPPIGFVRRSDPNFYFLGKR
jgi:hypothetical protein